ncbi:MAG: GDSL-type esterase/lipase family protein [Pleurocapsa sp.]
MTTIFSNNSPSGGYDRQIALQNSQPLKIIAVGDSLIYGFGDFVGGGWVERLRRQWMSPTGAGHVLYNLGVRGNRVFQVSQRLKQEFSCRGELRNRLPDLILLSVGVNDSARLGKPDGKLYTDFAEFKLEIANLLDLAQSFCPVLFIGMTPVNESQMPFFDCFYYNHFDQYRYKQATMQACQQHNIPYLDLFELWMSRGEDWVRKHLSDDGLHPNVAGYESLLTDVMNWNYISQLPQNLENSNCSSLLF